MSAGTYNFVMDQGSDFTRRFTLNQGGAPLNLTGYFARAQMRSTKTSNTVIATFTCTVLTPNTNGQIQMTLGNANTANIASGKYYYDLEIYTANNASVTRILQGEVTVTPEITK